jgi:hypothetical protein
MAKDIMEVEKLLPDNFDGTFRFTNWSDEDFVGKWGSKEYHFASQTTSPMVIHDQTPLEIQQIRKKFAKDLAEREFFKSKQFESLRLREGPRDDMGMIQPRGQGMSHAGQYTLDTLTPYIQKCLEPLTIAQAVVTEAPKQDMENKLSRDDGGELNTIAVKKDGDLIEEKKSLKRKALG